MKLWLVSQDENKNYDTFDSFVVACETQEEAAATHPKGGRIKWDGQFGEAYEWETRMWASRKQSVSVAYIGEARPGMPAGIVCASFNAG